MRTMSAIAALFFFTSFNSVARAKVPEIPVPGLPDIAITSMAASGQIVIYYNPLLVQQSGPALAAFFYAHEYGHVELRHLQRKYFETDPYNRNWMNIVLEEEADCWAARKMARENPAAVQAAIRWLDAQTGGPSRPDYPTWMQRAATVRRCGVPDTTCADRCETEARTCRAGVTALNVCLNDRLTRCVDLCLGEGAGYQQCVLQICRGDDPVNFQSWSSVCREQIGSERAVCEQDLADCRSACD